MVASMEGFLNKKGGSGSGTGLVNLGRHSWKRRWFVLEGCYLFYFEDFDPKSSRPVGAAKGVVNISGGECGRFPHRTRAECLAVNKANGAQMVMEAPSERLKNAWIEAIDRAIERAADPDAPADATPPGLDQDEFYERLGLDAAKKHELTDKDLKRAYRKATLKHHPDKGGDPDAFQAVHEAYEIITSTREAKLEAAKFCECLFSKEVAKTKKGMGLIVCEDRRRGGIKIKADCKDYDDVACVHRGDGVARRLPRKHGRFLAGDLIVKVGRDDTRGWSMTRLVQRLDPFRVPVGASVAFTVARDVRLDAFAPDDEYADDDPEEADFDFGAYASAQPIEDGPPVDLETDAMAAVEARADDGAGDEGRLRRDLDAARHDAEVEREGRTHAEALRASAARDLEQALERAEAAEARCADLQRALEAARDAAPPSPASSRGSASPDRAAVLARARKAALAAGGVPKDRVGGVDADAILSKFEAKLARLEPPVAPDWAPDDHPNKTWVPPKSHAPKLARHEFRSRRASVQDSLKYRPKHADVVAAGYTSHSSHRRA